MDKNKSAAVLFNGTEEEIAKALDENPELKEMVIAGMRALLDNEALQSTLRELSSSMGYSAPAKLSALLDAPPSPSASGGKSPGEAFLARLDQKLATAQKIVNDAKSLQSKPILPGKNTAH